MLHTLLGAVQAASCATLQQMQSRCVRLLPCGELRGPWGTSAAKLAQEASWPSDGRMTTFGGPDALRGCCLASSASHAAQPALPALAAGA